VKIVASQTGGDLIQAGAVVEGVNAPSSLPDLSQGLAAGLQALTQLIEEMTRKYGHLLDEAKKIPESEAYKNLEKELERLMDQMKYSSESMQRLIEKEIIPKIQKEMERLKKKMEPPEATDKPAEPTQNT
jgi:NTP pyrophosphatase (non-canonical NTP hydrolase)